MLKEKAIPNAQSLVAKPKEKLLPQKLFDYVTVKIDLPKEEHVVIPAAPHSVRVRDSADTHQEEEQKDSKHGQRE